MRALPLEQPLRTYAINKLSTLLLSKLLLPEYIFVIMSLSSQGQIAFAKFFIACSFKQKHYLITQMLNLMQPPGPNQSPQQAQLNSSLSEVLNQMLYHQSPSRDQAVMEAQLEMMLFAWCFCKQNKNQQAMQKLFYNLQANSVAYLSNGAWKHDPLLVKESYILLSLKEDMHIDNPQKFIEEDAVFPAILNMYLLSIAPTHLLAHNLLQIVSNLTNRDLKRYRIDIRVINEWIQTAGVQKYQFNFIKMFGTEFVSYNELNLVKCLNLSLKGRG